MDWLPSNVEADIVAVVFLVGIAYWLWPTEVMDTPWASLTAGMMLRIVGSALFAFAGLSRGFRPLVGSLSPSRANALTDSILRAQHAFPVTPNASLVGCSMGMFAGLLPFFGQRLHARRHKLCRYQLRRLPLRTFIGARTANLLSREHSIS
jgi:hypothetical protein